MLAGGKKVAPQPIENELKKSPFIGLPIVIGDRQKFLAALIVPNFDRLKEWAAAAFKHDLTGRRSTRTRRSARLFQRRDRRVQRGQAAPRADPRLRAAARAT